MPFCTSHSSGIGSSDKDLHHLAGDANWLNGRRFSGSESRNTIAEWLEELDLKFINDVSQFDLDSGKNGNAPTVMLNSDYKMPILGLGTYSLHGDTVKNSVRTALENGVRLIDEYNSYEIMDSNILFDHGYVYWVDDNIENVKEINDSYTYFRGRSLKWKMITKK